MRTDHMRIMLKFNDNVYNNCYMKIIVVGGQRIIDVILKRRSHQIVGLLKIVESQRLV